jgi:hypothetical protein
MALTSVDVIGKVSSDLLRLPRLSPSRRVRVYKTVYERWYVNCGFPPESGDHGQGSASTGQPSFPALSPPHRPGFRSLAAQRDPGSVSKDLEGERKW